MSDLKKRISNYEAAYESVGDEEGAFVKLYNLSSKVTANQVFGRMSKSVLPYMMSLHVVDRPVYLASLPGGSDVANADGEGAEGWPAFARKIAGWLQRSTPYASLRLLSSTQPAAIGAASLISEHTGVASVTHQSGLNPLDRGVTAAAGGLLPSQIRYTCYIPFCAVMCRHVPSCAVTCAPRAGDVLLSQMRFDQRFAGGESFQVLPRCTHASHAAHTAHAAHAAHTSVTCATLVACVAHGTCVT